MNIGPCCVRINKNRLYCAIAKHPAIEATFTCPLKDARMASKILQTLWVCVRVLATTSSTNQVCRLLHEAGNGQPFRLLASMTASFPRRHGCGSTSLEPDKRLSEVFTNMIELHPTAYGAHTHPPFQADGLGATLCLPGRSPARPAILDYHFRQFDARRSDDHYKTTPQTHQLTIMDPLTSLTKKAPRSSGGYDRWLNKLRCVQASGEGCICRSAATSGGASNYPTACA